MGKRVSEDIAIQRREMVSSLRRRGMSLDEITHQLATEYFRNEKDELIQNRAYFVNPHTGEPFDRSTIGRDIQKLRDLANERAAQNADEIRAELLDRSEEIYRITMRKKHEMAGLEVLKFQAKLMGANQPEKTEVRWDDKQIGKIDLMKGLFQAMRQQEIENGHSETD